MIFTKSNAIEELTTQARTRIRMKSDDLLPDIVPAFLKMIEHPPTGTWAFDYLALSPGDVDWGLIRRDGKSGYDKKWFFHYRPRLHELLAKAGTDYHQYEAMFDACRELFYRCQSAVRLVARELGTHRTDLVIPRFGNAQTVDYDTVRLIAYTEMRAGEDKFDGATDVTARSHRDRNGLTLAINESHGGLEGAPGDKEKIYAPFSPILHLENRPICLIGGKLQDLNGGGRTLPALVHRVRQMEKDRVSNSVIRWSVVFFAQPEGTEGMRVQTHY